MEALSVPHDMQEGRHCRSVSIPVPCRLEGQWRVCVLVTAWGVFLYLSLVHEIASMAIFTLMIFILLQRGLASTLGDVRHYASLGRGRKSIIKPEAHTCCIHFPDNNTSIASLCCRLLAPSHLHSKTAWPVWASLVTRSKLTSGELTAGERDLT